MDVRYRSLIVAVVAGFALTACGAGDDTAAPGPAVSSLSSSPPLSTSPEPPPSPSSTATSRPGKSTPPAAGQLTVTGTVEAGVEPGCTLLSTGDKVYLLVGGDRAVIERSRRLTVVGTPQPDLMSTCQQGVPFRVSEARPA
jgi:hypothetical protein